MQRLTVAIGASVAYVARGTCPTGLELYSDEASPFGWPVTPSEWTYARPECWAEKYARCGGLHQSPMDLDFTRTTADCTPKAGGTEGDLAKAAAYAVHGEAPLVVSMSKYMRAASVSGSFGTLRLKNSDGHDVEYEATSMHLSADSFHSFSGAHADAELLIVHKPVDQKDAMAQAVIVSVLFQQSADAPESPLFSHLGFKQGAMVNEMQAWEVSSHMDLGAMLAAPLAGPTYAYLGSEPAPPCSQSVHYIVAESRLPVQAAQVALLKDGLVRFVGGYHKRPPAPRVIPSSTGDVCREVVKDSLTVFAVGSQCDTPTDRNAACWECKMSPVALGDQRRLSEADHASSHADHASAHADHSVPEFKYEVAKSVVVNTSMYTVDVVGDFGAALINGRQFVARKVMIKAMSSHTINGHRYAGELVVEHSYASDAFGAHDDNAHVVQLIVPLKLGRQENPLITSLGLGETAHQNALVHGNGYPLQDAGIDLGRLLAPSLDKPFYWYSGGPMGPGTCPAWGVKKIVYKEPLPVNVGQLSFLRVPVSGFDSTPPLQPLWPPAVVHEGGIPAGGLSTAGCEGHEEDHATPFCWSDKFAICAAGKAQSPIDIRTEFAAKLDGSKEGLLAKTSWKPVSKLHLQNTGKSIGFDTEQLGYITLNGKTGYPQFYQVTNVALRMPSEHFLNGKQFPAELQVVHKAQESVLELDDKDMLITSFFFDFGKPGEESKLLKQLLPAKLPQKGESTIITQPVDLMWGLGPALDGPYFAYNGSLTEPGCAEVVRWALFETPLKMSRDQWKAFSAAFPHGNNRPLQSTEGRPVWFNRIEGNLDEVDKEFFLSRQFGADRATTDPRLILAPIAGTLSLCLIMMCAIFQREDSHRKKLNAGGLEGVEPATYGKGYGRL